MSGTVPSSMHIWLRYLRCVISPRLLVLDTRTKPYLKLTVYNQFHDSCNWLLKSRQTKFYYAVHLSWLSLAHNSCWSPKIIHSIDTRKIARFDRIIKSYDWSQFISQNVGILARESFGLNTIFHRYHEWCIFHKKKNSADFTPIWVLIFDNWSLDRKLRAIDGYGNMWVIFKSASWNV